MGNVQAGAVENSKVAGLWRLTDHERAVPLQFTGNAQMSPCRLNERLAFKTGEKAMLKSIKIAALSAAIGLGSLAAIPGVAQANGLQVGISSHSINVGYGGGYGWRNACTPQKAVSKAKRMGVRHARVRSISQHTIRIAGVRHGHRVNVAFSKARHCPVIRW